MPKDEEMDEENGNEKEEKKKMNKELEGEEKAEEVLDDKEYESEVLEKESINLKDLDEHRQIGAEISTEMKRSYIDYAMSVIVSRALPSCEDGLKPVHRRILYAMDQMGLGKGPTKKSARIVGECFVKDTQILTTRGLLPIEEIQKGEFVYTQKGVQKVTELYEMPEKRLLKVTLSNGISNIVTCSQQFKVLNKKLEYEWKEAKDLTEEDFVVIRAEYPDFKDNFKLKLFNNRYLELNENIAYLLGQFLSDGWIEKKTNRIAFCSASVGVISKVASILQSEFGYIANTEQKIRPYQTSSGQLIQSQLYQIRINNRLLCNFLTNSFNLAGKDAYTKEIPHQILLSPKRVIYSFISGLVDGDGSIHKFRNVINYTSVSERLIDKLLLITQQLGIIGRKFLAKSQSPHFVNGRIVNSTCPIYYIEFNGIFAKKLLSSLNLKEERKKERAEKLLVMKPGKSDFEIIPSVGNSVFVELSDKHLGGGWYSDNGNKKFRLGIKYPDGCKIRYSKNLKELELRQSQILEWNILEKLKKINSKYYTFLKEIYDNKLYFLKVKKIEEADPEKTYDIQVNDAHEFVANGLISHNCMGKFHPHGDMAIYDALVRMAQDFSLRYPLVHGQGNFGNVDGDSAAASRYTEAKLGKMAVDLLADLEKDTVKFIPNFDNSMEEPLLLPGKVPNLLINGSSGIAVGMATNIPPHNLTEVCEAISAVIDNPKITTEEIMGLVKGPDFPTGGVVVAENLKQLYETGRGGFIIRGKVTTEEGERDKDSIIITEIPYQVNKSDLVKEIAELIRDKKLPDVSDIRDESARGKVRVVIELKKGADSKFTINRLYKSTNLQTKFDAVVLALVNGVPQVLSLKQILNVYIDYRRKIIRSRTKFELKEAEDREHLVQGLLICLKNIDEVVAVIKKAREGVAEILMDKFKLSKKQAEAILEMKLRQLTALEHDKLKKEEDELKAKIKELQEILNDEKLIFKLIKKDLSDLKREYGDERRTKLIAGIKELTEKELVKKEDVIVSITDKGYIKRMPFQAYREQKRGGKGVIGADLSTGDFVKQVISCSTHDYLLLFTQRGRVFWLKAYQVPETQRYGRGQALINLLSLKDDNVTSVLSIKEFKNGFLFLATKLGVVKKMKLEMFSNPRASGVRAINLPLDNTDSLIDVASIVEHQEVMMTTKEGQAIRFNSDEVRDMGRASYGVTGIKLNKNDEVVSLVTVKNAKTETVLTVTRDGYGKRSLIDDYRITGRACKGVINLKVTGKNGEVIRTIGVVDGDQILVSTVKGIMIKTPVKQLRIMGRATQGVHVIRLSDGDKVSDVAVLSKDEAEEEGEGKAA